MKPRDVYRLMTFLSSPTTVGICRLLRASSTKLQMLGGGNQERNLVDKHDVDGQCYRPMNLHDIWGTPIVCILTCGLGRHTVFPLRDPRLGPNISSATWISSLVIRQLWKCLMITSANRCGPGHMMMFWRCLAWAAALYARRVYLSACLSTVVRKLHMSSVEPSLVRSK